MNEFEKDTVELMKHIKEYSLKYGVGERKYITSCVIKNYVSVNNETGTIKSFGASTYDEPYKTALADV